MESSNMKTLQEIIESLTPRTNESDAYKMGYDCGKNGANTTNCNFLIFATPQNQKAWERGKAEGAKDKK